MTTFTEGSGNLLAADVDALVNTVNTVGVMGKGIALQFKRAYPEMFRAYERACRDGDVQLGQMFVFDAGQLVRPRWIINFPTKKHWRSRSKLSDIAAGLDELRRTIEKLDLSSIAVPPLGCGNGGLDWSDVGPLILEKLDGVDAEVRVFAPAGPPAAAEMPVRTEPKPLTPPRAALVAMLDRYTEHALGATLVEVQKLMYFLQEAGEPLQLRYEPNRYGPYADNLRHVLVSLEGHQLSGFGDGSRPVQEAEPIEVRPGAAEDAEKVLLDSVETTERMDRVLSLIEGYESPYGLELLATVHWAATHDEHGATDDVETITERVQSWTDRKSRMFTSDHIAAAWSRLVDRGWVTQPAVV
ncbi:MAG: macro domain-containing protein [Actinomycetota bacterium]|nr:macro domain-containing protein [Actinomycetota bacterium]